jgi:hypothetical protein
VSRFEVEYKSPELITITLELQQEDLTILLVENVCIRNSLQRIGKRVR